MPSDNSPRKHDQRHDEFSKQQTMMETGYPVNDQNVAAARKEAEPAGASASLTEAGDAAEASGAANADLAEAATIPDGMNTGPTGTNASVAGADAEFAEADVAGTDNAVADAGAGLAGTGTGVAAGVNDDVAEAGTDRAVADNRRTGTETAVSGTNMGLTDETQNRDPVEDFYEEFAAEAAPFPARGLEDRATQLAESPREDDSAPAAPAFGWAGLILGIASLFVWPIVLGPAAAVIGLISWTQGSRALGVWSIVLGVISFISYLVLAPLYG